ncbi:hypothetical protein BDF21DRAFT_491166 [Thamnidium elegans]|nr:hypothetical protein BDF21DRAFT_491166 [Thamnidium elegans]
MGTTCSKMKVLNTGLSVLDHGSLIPQGIYTADVDYDTNIVRALIRKGQLAPFYDGSTEPCINNKKLSFETECPICFLFYPSKMNRTRCCDKSICTECFLQLRRSSSSPLVPAVCPFCVQPNLGVLYVPPAWSKHYNAFKKRRSDLFIDDNDMNRRKWKLEADDPDVVLVDTIRPRWEEMLEERRSSAVGTTRRRRVQLNNGEPITADSRRRRRPSRHALSLHHANGSNNTIYDTFADMDLEDVFVMEAIRLSLVNNNNT